MKRKSKRAEKVMKVLVVLIASVLVVGCCSVGVLMFLGSTTSGPIPTAIPVTTSTRVATATIPGVVTTEANASNATAAAATPLPTLTLQPTAISTLVPAEVPGNLPSTADMLWQQASATCLEGGGMVSVGLEVMHEAMTAEPLDIELCCVAMKGFEVAVTYDKACWADVPLPSNPDLLESHLLYNLALDHYALSAGLYLDFCTTGDMEYIDLSLEALREASDLVGQASDAIDRYLAGITE